MTTISHPRTLGLDRRPRGPLPLPEPTAMILKHLRPWIHQLRPHAAMTLASVTWADLQAEPDSRFVAAAIRARLGLPEYAHFLVDKYDPNDRVETE